MVVPKDELAVAIVDALNAWSGVDFNLAILFQILSEIPSNKKSHAIFDTIISFEVRLDIIDTLMDDENLSELDGEIWRRLSNKITKKHKLRHGIAHFTLEERHEVHGGPGNWRVMPFFTLGTLMRAETKYLALEDIRARGAVFDQLRSALHWMTFETQRRRGQILSNPMPEPQLIGACRELAVQILAKRQQQHPA